MAQVCITRAAAADLDAILTYSIARHGREVAEAYLRDLDRALERLADYPELGAPRPELGTGRRCLICREHRIFYRIDDPTVLIGRVLHKAMYARRWLD